MPDTVRHAELARSRAAASPTHLRSEDERTHAQRSRPSDERGFAIEGTSVPGGTSDLISLQRAIGNQAVQRLLFPNAGGKGPEQGVEGYAIRGSGDEAVTSQMGGHGATREVLQRDDGDDDPQTTPTASGGKTATTAPPTLAKSTVKGPTSGPRGKYSWTVQWKLSGPSPLGGWIVQKLDFSGSIKDSAGAAVSHGWEGTTPYWEAWKVNKGKSVTTYAEGGDVDDDTFSNPSYAAGTRGSVTETGAAEFYEGLTLPSSFKADPSSPAGILPVTKSSPSLSGGTGGIAHNLTATWDSSKGDDKTTLSTT
jgi:hypothetical protein